jgi:predicted nucleic acid-binding protein
MPRIQKGTGGKRLANDRPLTAHLVPDASLVIRWYSPHEPGWEAARRYFSQFVAGALDLTAPDLLKIEVARRIQLGVRDKIYSDDDGVDRLRGLLALGISYVSDDLLLEDAFRLSTRYQVALYDALYLAVGQALEIPFATADRRLFNLAQQRGITEVVWFEDLALAGEG